jgi:hypothetical protein
MVYKNWDYVQHIQTVIMSSIFKQLFPETFKLSPGSHNPMSDNHSKTTMWMATAIVVMIIVYIINKMVNHKQFNPLTPNDL